MCVTQVDIATFINVSVVGSDSLAVMLINYTKFRYIER